MRINGARGATKQRREEHLLANCVIQSLGPAEPDAAP